MKLVLFDFDGTLTHQDMFTKFILYSATPLRLVLGAVFMSPLYLLYKLGVIPARKLRPFVSFFAFVGRSSTKVAAIGEAYASGVIPSCLRTDMLQTLRLHQTDGATIVLVSASLDLYLKPWCQTMGIALICSEMASDGKRYSGYYRAGDCSCEVKAYKVSQEFDLSRYSQIYAYGDTKEDLAMLALADRAFMRGVEQ
ncbi:HAD-superfamily hydrolase, subfamily IB (PSPase-like) [Shewanella halifaxensis HAW-EB4]|uniref:HAD-superfamily hydrolase, subfamily IB (PSPase-like) n=1 Tax=Shewanella halifaxensis (strain HAW-EB4) TaxID=458817 RepID=B0TRT5_SHEHH|nr:HAD-IB family hydrolase [Shewanella halifaxensis]ABZ77847.1 HAD-superfamily hydrolase, subfamily IB (PSPase-like) [Shewanella halifaxensis HAW-EB4]